MRTEAIDSELTRVRESGPLREVKIPPCPELLTRLRKVMEAREPDLAEVQAIASADVAMGRPCCAVPTAPCIWATARPA
jgi:HD-like signal output (HDOD) protein